jgi:hypothetical protein
MSYARKSYCDVYVFLSVGGQLECCMCDLPGPSTFVSTTTAEMVAHLDQHRAAGHDVPADTYAGLREDQRVNDRWMALVASGMESDAAWDRACEEGGTP